MSEQTKKSEFQGEGFGPEFEEKTIEIRRVAKVVKGGRRFSFRVTVVVGDRSGQVGAGVGKANTVPEAIRKATTRARKTMRRMHLYSTTIPHVVVGRQGGSEVLLKPASAGTGVIAGGGVRAVLQAVGVQDILTKSMGSPNIHNVVMATMDALNRLKSVDDQATMRGKEVAELKPFWDRRSKTNGG
ncbi:MAG TPA: 30S ribosomal protein S5 [Anaerolineales bacterium]|jgi:small subunit ribosomal protein S5|uniref:Small ribosomal subunit protein uS5 n=1 Tax=uncultured Chloroflexi bacterium Rifle_16ft_4_minimus_1477 TaxID=1665058 RepID=A0A0H4T403_9CHLR|nr:30S ribosomal protein S5, small subunit ribosomal protein S5 [uncultured Chloroflexi bacterium Rifle_16ft_4_minimus_1477]HLD94438.1 30S ribosomal protein S5 [Anaerolineales bacterium]